MNIEQLEKGLLAKFEQSRIVFWQDQDLEFVEQLSQLHLSDVSMLKVDDMSHFEVKQIIELVEPMQRFLLYSTHPQPEVTRDWLFDIRLYSETFYADSSSMILNEIGMRMEFRQLIGRYKKFFTSKQRLQKLKKLLPENANQDELELTMLSVLIKSDSPGFVPLMQQIILTLSDDLDSTEVIDELAKFDLQPALARLLEKEFGYSSLLSVAGGHEALEKSGIVGLNLKDLLLKLLITDFYHGLVSSGLDVSNSRLAQSLLSHLLPMASKDESAEANARHRFSFNSSKRAAVINFVSGLRESRVLNNSYNQLTSHVQHLLEIKSRLSEITDVKDPTIRVKPELLAQVDTFEVVEQAIISMLAKQLPAFDSVEVEALISKRLMGHWCFINPNYAAIYRAIRAAKQLYDLKLRYAEGFNYTNAKEFYVAYQQELFQFDACYRVFCENAVNVAQNGSDVLKLTGLVDDIENLYVDWYLHDLAIAWGRLVDKEQLLANWSLPSVHNQYQFYRHHVRHVLDTTQNKRVFVVISDALRYEVAYELTQQINDEKRLKAEISSQLGVVPSYTQLGMAALLPHEKLTAHLGNRTEFRADGLSVHGLENRQKILAKHHGLAFKSSEVLSWTNQEGREKVKDAQVVYIYHDEIDAIGDKAVTENQTFQACRDAINELNNLISRIINRLNGSRVVVTADHGFLYKMTDVVDTDKTSLKAKPNGAIDAKKRYVIGTNLPRYEDFWTGKMANTARLDVESGDDAEFIVPRGSNRFNFVGGAKFIHGGLMPQEVCVPVIHVRELDTKAQTKHAKQSVGVVPLHSPLKLVSNIDRIQLLQTEPVGDKFKARELSLWIEDSEGNIVSAREKLLFDSTSEKMDERKKALQIALSGKGFSRSAQYKLVMLDLENNLKYNSFSVTIDLAFEDDFF
jgi:uncharacterized protein (TIGR02687 family)